MNISLTTQGILLVMLCMSNASRSSKEREKPKLLSSIYGEIRGYIKQFPKFSSMTRIGKSVEGRPIYCVEIHDRSVRNKVTIVANFGIHAREWASQQSGLFLIRQLLVNQNLRHHIQTTKWLIIPVLNPDGYYFSTTKYSLWRKNRRPLSPSRCFGVDLNRNFAVGWDKSLSKEKNLCREIYSGPKPMSEPEIRTLEDFLKKVSHTDAYVDVHACAQSILHPYGYSKEKLPKEKLRKLKDVASQMKNAMKKVRGTNYKIQSAADLYVAGGGSDDFAFQKLHIPTVFTLELGDDVLDDHDCFHPSSNKMRNLQRECLQAFLALNKNLIRDKEAKTKRT